MKNKPTLAIITVVLLLITPFALADGDPPVPPWERGQKRAHLAAVDTRPPAELPSGLHRAETSPAPDAHARVEALRSNGNLERRLIEDARRAAMRQVAGPGVRNYFRVGFYQGMLDALNDERIGRRDFRQGLHDGESDREARRIGRQLGSDAALDLALVDAESAVESQFLDLQTEPVFAPTADVPVWVAPAVDLDVPSVGQLLAEFSLSNYGPLDREFDLYLNGWDWDSERLYGCPGYSEFYNKDWDSGNRAFRQWQSNPRNARLLRGLSSDDVQRLRVIFADAFVLNIDRLSERKLVPAWSIGMDRGWEYGRFVHEELDYRTGFAKGFRRHASLVAKSVFGPAYLREFDVAYERSFDRWSTTAVPAVGNVRLLDGNDDGVFEPGERIVADVELINFGGAEGRFTATLDGAVLAEVDSKKTQLPRRSTVLRRGLLEVVIGSSVRPRTRAELMVRIGAESKSVQLRINRPLEWVAESLRLSRDNLEGRVRVELDVRNLSTRERSAEVSLTASTREEMGLSQVLNAVRPREEVTVRFDVENLAPLDLIGGRVSLDLFLDADEIEQDRLTAALGETATDLSSRELPRLLRRMIAEGASAIEVTQVRDLLLRRLRADWRDAVRANGNPYKRDYRSGGDLTALGELVQLSSSSPRSSDRSALLGGLSSEVLTLARQLPGPHPLLRKYVRRLARRLP